MNEEKVKELLRESGLKVTSQRLMVMNILASHPDSHLTAEEIYDLAKESSPEIGLATIYRTLQVLLDLHLINKVDFDDGFARYELNGESGASGSGPGKSAFRKPEKKNGFRDRGNGYSGGSRDDDGTMYNPFAALLKKSESSLLRRTSA